MNPIQSTSSLTPTSIKYYKGFKVRFIDGNYLTANFDSPIDEINIRNKIAIAIGLVEQFELIPVDTQVIQDVNFKLPSIKLEEEQSKLKLNKEEPKEEKGFQLGRWETSTGVVVQLIRRNFIPDYYEAIVLSKPPNLLAIPPSMRVEFDNDGYLVNKYPTQIVIEIGYLKKNLEGKWEGF